MAHRKNIKRIDPRYFLHETRASDELEEGWGWRKEDDEELEEGFISAMADFIRGTPEDQQRERDLDPLAYDREVQAAEDSDHQGHPSSADQDPVYSRPHKRPVREAKGPESALHQWRDMFPEAAKTLLDILDALGGEDIEGLVKYDRSPEERAQSAKVHAAGMERRGPQPDPTWGKHQEAKEK